MRNEQNIGQQWQRLFADTLRELALQRTLAADFLSSRSLRTRYLSDRVLVRDGRVAPQEPLCLSGVRVLGVETIPNIQILAPNSSRGIMRSLQRCAFAIAAACTTVPAHAAVLPFPELAHWIESAIQSAFPGGHPEDLGPDPISPADAKKEADARAKFLSCAACTEELTFLTRKTGTNVVVEVPPPWEYFQYAESVNGLGPPRPAKVFKIPRRFEKGQQVEFDGCADELCQIGVMKPGLPTTYGVTFRVAIFGLPSDAYNSLTKGP